MKPEGLYHPCLPASVVQDHHNPTATHSTSGGLNFWVAALTSWFQADVRVAHSHLALILATVVLRCVLHREHILNIRNEYIKEAHRLHRVSLI